MWLQATDIPSILTFLHMQNEDSHDVDIIPQEVDGSEDSRS
jgi:hypothetical protein